MTEAEWLSLTRTTSSLMDFLSERMSDRKRRLYAVACCYRIWSSLGSESLRAGVEAADRLADGRITDDEVVELRRVIDEAVGDRYEWRLSAPNAVKYAIAPADRVNGSTSGAYAAAAAAYSATGGDNREGQFYRIEGEENREQIRLLLPDIFGNPFRPVTFDPSWRTEAVVALARGMYESRDFAPIPVLADALEDAGCADADVLAHCRGDGPHVRGCWVVDLVLGKS